MPHGKSHIALAELLRLKEADSEATTSDVIEGVLDALRSHLVMDVGLIAEFVDGRTEIRFVSCPKGPVPIAIGRADPFFESYFTDVARGRLPNLIPNVQKSPFAADLRASDALPIGAHLSVPLRLSDGRVYGALCCFSHAPDQNLNRRNLDVLRIGAQLIAEMIDRKARRNTRRKELSRKIDDVVEGGHFKVVYQPIYEIASRTMVGVEALVRFDDSEQRSPSSWFDEADEVGSTVELETAIIRCALRGLQGLPDGVYLSLNASLQTLKSSQLQKMLEEAPTGKIVIELTEHESVEDYHELSKHLQGLPGSTRLAIDDVGAGYSSMRHILDLGPEIIKLDVSMVRDIHRRPSRSAFVKAIAEFARTSGSTIVAEGVESQEEFDELEMLGVACAQGYFLGRPIPLLKLVQCSSTQNTNSETGGSAPAGKEPTDERITSVNRRTGRSC